MNSLIFCISNNAPNGGKFSDNKHRENFTNYLFNKSKGHPENELSTLNMIHYGDTTLLNDDGAKHKREFNKWFKANGYDDTNTIYDLHYMIYFVVANNGKKIYTNFFGVHGDELIRNFPNELFMIIAEDYNYSKQELVNVVDKYCKNADVIYSLDSIPDKLRFHIEHQFINHIEEQTGKKTILSVSHADQDLFHIHRIITR
ncbi:hypothetical protein [Vibrio furnissii]|uniref:hypothetical protein n=1 Tax=Vibrio furnissii TaxID=29494 RepID=UPI001EEC4E76|nr:hypothetical protein [Vibrio furnissii]MCG6268576.1 hypothetical protein [Vibrio furnissii]